MAVKNNFPIPRRRMGKNNIMNIRNVIIQEVNEVESGKFVSVEKLEHNKSIQTKLTRGSPFFFGEDEKSAPTQKFKFTDWLSLHKAEAIGFGVLVAGVVVIVLVN